MLKQLKNTIENLQHMYRGQLGVEMIHNGDCQQILSEVPNNTVDCICTDPPYGYSFMGKDWDKAVPSIEVWKECHRILKPGAFMFVMSAPRQDVLSQMIMRIAASGFDVDFTSIYWTYATGFPKAMNMAKAVDKKLGVERTVVGTKVLHDIRSGSLLEASQEDLKKDQQMVEMEITAATSPQAKELDGSYGGFQPKPAVEVIIVAMKPLSERNYIEQALHNGHGLTWLDKCRIPYQSEADIGDPNRCKGYPLLDPKKGWNQNHIINNITIGEKGRFPANLLVSDNVLCVKSKGALAPVKSGQKGFGGKIYGKYKSGGDDGASFYSDKEDSTTFSRYFDLDAWWSKTVENLPVEVQQTYPFLIVPKASKSEKSKDCQKNSHPTVKPLKLMCYLITLGSREGEIVVDPFNGSGTTCLAAKLLGRKWLGIELSEEYCQIAAARLGGASIIKHDSTTQQPKQEPITIKPAPTPKPATTTASTQPTCTAKQCTFKDANGNCSGNGLKLRGCKDRRTN